MTALGVGLQKVSLLDFSFGVFQYHCSISLTDTNETVTIDFNDLVINLDPVKRNKRTQKLNNKQEYESYRKKDLNTGTVVQVTMKSTNTNSAVHASSFMYRSH